MISTPVTQWSLWFSSSAPSVSSTAQSGTKTWFRSWGRWDKHHFFLSESFLILWWTLLLSLTQLKWYWFIVCCKNNTTVFTMVRHPSIYLSITQPSIHLQLEGMSENQGRWRVRIKRAPPCAAAEPGKNCCLVNCSNFWQSQSACMSACMWWVFWTEVRLLPLACWSITVSGLHWDRPNRPCRTVLIQPGTSRSK